ncbi:MAG: hypothetical protein JO359_04840 [Candidatus Eremiobacteraeota bacterium]|nr:hypothetical protein [Candidatus Eremiobacteraeota bacterium]
MTFRSFLTAIFVGTFAAVPMAASAQTLPWPIGNILGQWNPGTWGYNNGNSINTGGVVASTQGSSLTLQNGVTVFLHQGTVINPTGTTLQPGMQVRVLGGPGGNNAINANEVDITGYANNGQYGYGSPYGYNGNPYPYSSTQQRDDRWQREQWQRRQAQEQWQRQQAQGQLQRDQQQRASRYNNGNWQSSHRRDDGQDRR